MDYIIQDVMVGQILVRFEDGSRAIVPVKTTDTPDEIDHAVSFYDPDFLEVNQDEINQSISAGEKRFSIRLDDENGEEAPDPSLPPVEQPESDPARDARSLIPLDDAMMLYFAHKYSAQGDNRVSDALDGLMDNYYQDITPETILEFIARKDIEVTTMKERTDLTAASVGSADDIFNEAMAELEAQGQ